MRLLHVCLFCLVAGAAPSAAPQSGPTAVANETLRVAVREVPPFSWKDEAGAWHGLSVDLWTDIAKRENLAFQWQEVSLEDTWPALEAGQIDAAISALSITADRQAKVDFSHPYLVSGLSPAYRTDGGSGWLATLEGVFSLPFLGAVGSLIVLLLGAGAVIWMLERKHNAEQFEDRNLLRGLGAGIWWSAVTMTTVGYGDKAPKTFGGRVVALIWMFASLILVASFTATIAASLAANRLQEDRLRSTPMDQLKIGVVRGTAAEEYAEGVGARLKPADSLDDALDMLVARQVDVVVHDAPLLKFVTRERFQDVVVDDRVLVRDDYGFAFAPYSKLRKPVNNAMLATLVEPEWAAIKRRYLGSVPN